MFDRKESYFLIFIVARYNIILIRVFFCVPNIDFFFVGSTLQHVIINMGNSDKVEMCWREVVSTIWYYTRDASRYVMHVAPRHDNMNKQWEFHGLLLLLQQLTKLGKYTQRKIACICILRCSLRPLQTANAGMAKQSIAINLSIAIFYWSK